MTISTFTASVPVFIQTLEALSGILTKAADQAAARKIDPAVLCATRLIPDMLPFTRQVLIACDFAKNGTARIAGVEAPVFEDTETTLAELQARIARTLDFVRAVDPALVAAAPGRIVTFNVGPTKMQMEAVNYLFHFVMPNFYFHVTTAYAILRSNGFDIGKRDFIGVPPGLTPA